MAESKNRSQPLDNVDAPVPEGKDKYRVVISKIVPKANNGFRYEVNVHWDKYYNGKVFDTSRSSWSYTIWGARREAKKLIKKHEIALLYGQKEEIEHYTA